MTLPQPAACHPHAFQFFRQQLEHLDTNSGLLRACIAIALHEMPEVDPKAVERQLDEMVGRVRRRVPSLNQKALLAHLHVELFDNLGFCGNENNYYTPQNSYLPVVMETGRGIPISLALVYVYVARRLGLSAEGINAPGHFLVQVSDGRRPLLVDPFSGGSTLSREEAYRRVENVLSMPIDRDVELLKSATHQQWIERMLRNLIQIFGAEDHSENETAMRELLQLLQSVDDE